MTSSTRMALLGGVLAAGLMTAGCDDDDDDNPMNSDVPRTGSLAGEVTFQGTWPTTGDVQVSVYGDLNAPWVPMGPPEQSTDPFSGTPSTASYVLDGLEEGTYDAIYVSWRDPANPSQTRLIGMYGPDAGDPGIAASGLPIEEPGGVEITSATLDLEGLDITASFDLLP